MNTSFERAARKDEWLTPPEIVRALGPFALDPCAPVKRPWDTADQHYTVEDNGLIKPWAGLTWCNPPYGNVAPQWFKRMREHGSGIMLTFARTETGHFFESVWGGADAIFFFRGRLSFFEFTCALCGAGMSKHTPEFEKENHAYISAAPNVIQGGTAGAPSVLIAYGEIARERVKNFREWDGHYLELPTHNSKSKINVRETQLI